MHASLEIASDESLLRILPGHEKWKEAPAEILAACARAKRDLPSHLVTTKLVSRQDVIKALLELKGAYFCAVEGEFVEGRISRTIPLESAIGAGLWPLAAIGQRLYVLSTEGVTPPRELRIDDTATFLVVSLGEVPNAKAKVRGCYAVLSRLDPARKSFPEFVRALGIQKERTGARHVEGESPTDRVKSGDDAVSEETLVQVRGAYSNLPVIDQRRIEELLDALVLGSARARASLPPTMLPLRIEQDALWVVSDQIPDPALLDMLVTKLSCARTRIFVATASAIAAAASVADSISAAPTAVGANDPDDAVPAIADHLLLEGVLRHCSDIHIERYEGRTEVRLRKDGNLFVYAESGVTRQNVQNVVTRLKVAAQLDIAETRRPQDGVIRKKFGERSIDYRVATQPTIWGENVVLRILEQSAPPKLDKLGFDEQQLAQLRRVLANPQGLLLVTGPTGSGKTTTLYAILQELKNPEVKILTAEDPVEYAIDGIQQSAVNEAIGDTFSRYIRAFLRQDPDIILVGEIRDEETAEAALRAALTGHLVLSTVHANDVFGVVRRIADLGIEPSLLAQTLEGIIGQRLARKVCNDCAEPHIPAPELLREFYPRGAPEGATFRKGRGCARCRQSGYAGRLALVEFWIPDEVARDVMDSNGHPAALRKAGADSGFSPLIVNAVRQAAAGITTLEELRSIVPYEYVARHIAGASVKP